jgi:hypothetical protein
MTWDGAPKTSWTPTLIGTGGVGAITYHRQDGWYTVLNGLATVFYRLNFDYTATTNTTWMIDNLPVTASHDQFGMSDPKHSNWYLAANPIYFSVLASSNYVYTTNNVGTALGAFSLGIGSQDITGMFQVFI